ncbi:hypothetical protein SOPP22_17745 [Shewanella sp. OPT22]|nr:hypothetical protein SOPP22_17745 [Shewanella sp. OPT22]
MKYHVNSTGPSKDGFTQGLRKALKLSMDNETKEVALAVHGKQNLSGIIEDILGVDFVKAMNKHGSVSTQGITIYLLTERITSKFSKGIILACHPSGKFLSKLSNDYRATDIIYVPWAQEEYDKYLENYDSVEIAL